MALMNLLNSILPNHLWAKYNLIYHIDYYRVFNKHVDRRTKYRTNITGCSVLMVFPPIGYVIHPDHEDYILMYGPSNDKEFLYVVLSTGNKLIRFSSFLKEVGGNVEEYQEISALTRGSNIWK